MKGIFIAAAIAALGLVFVVYYAAATADVLAENDE
jgi:hypothetical protein